MAQKVGRKFYEEATGYTHAPGTAVTAWVNQQKNQVRQAVAGYDFTFSPTKSISVLWALADEDTANAISRCHHDAVADTLRWVEDNVARTRRGAGGIEQVATRGLNAAEFTHFDTRTSDPDLHSHVLISNKVQSEDRSWKALDGQPIFAHH
ncbi:MobF family relaxase [Corynebacterium sp. CCM 9204]|uniref:MobF family relaxase n=1 Tax=Corynebacterium sp. CCM 9204 TaxID=3057616 RepID=UPI003525CC32